MGGPREVKALKTAMADISGNTQANDTLDPYVRLAFRNIPSPLWERMLTQHDGARWGVWSCRECWLVAKEYWERKVVMASRGIAADG